MKISIINIGLLVAPFLCVWPVEAQQLNEKFAGRTAFCWSGGSGSGQGVFCNHEPVVIQVAGPVQVREVKVPVPVPGPVQRIEVPTPAPVAKPIRE